MICIRNKSLRANEWKNICCTCVLYEHISLPSLTFVRCQATSSAPECNSAFSALFTLFTLFTPIIALSTSLHTSGNCIDLKEPHSSTFTKTKADIYVLLDLLASKEKKENRFSFFVPSTTPCEFWAHPHIYDNHHIITSVSLITPFTNDHFLQLREGLKTTVFLGNFLK